MTKHGSPSVGTGIYFPSAALLRAKANTAFFEYKYLTSNFLTFANRSNLSFREKSKKKHVLVKLVLVKTGNGMNKYLINGF
jgi:hypothetical protein